MKNKLLVAVLTALICALAAAPAVCAREWEPGPSKVPELLETRQANIWIDGSQFGDMIIGARASLQIIYVDKKLADAVTEDLKTDEWAKQMVQYLGSDAARGKGLFIAHIETFKPWDVDPKNVFIGGYSLRDGDVLSPSMTNPFGPLDSGVKGFFAFVVPLSELKKGKEIKIGYGDDYALWKAPK